MKWRIFRVRRLDPYIPFSRWAHARLGFRRLGDYNMFKLPKLAGNWTPKRRTPLVFISQPGSAVLIVTSPGSAFTRRFPLFQLDRVREDRVNDAGTEDLTHGIQIRWKFNFADRVIATITRHLCCCSMCITLQRCDSQEMNCNMYMISHRILMIEQLYFVIADKVIIIYRYLGFICFHHLA